MTDLIVFLKAPEPGTVKTRLQTRYTPEEAADLYRAFIRDTFVTVSGVRADRYIAAYTGDVELVRSITPPGWDLKPQTGVDLGERMLGALNASIDGGADRVVLIGTDIPSLPRDQITSAISRLDTSDVILGPTHDGGFYLIGTRVGLPDVFPGVVWSSDRVFEAASAGIRSLGLMLGLVPPWNDVDTPEDLDGVLRSDRSALTYTRAAADGLRR